MTQPERTCSSPCWSKLPLPAPSSAMNAVAPAPSNTQVDSRAATPGTFESTTPVIIVKMDGTKFQSSKFEEILRRSISPANFLARVLAANSQLFVSQQHALRLKPQVEAENPRLPTWHRLETGEATFLIWWFAGLPKSIIGLMTIYTTCWGDNPAHDPASNTQPWANSAKFPPQLCTGPGVLERTLVTCSK